MSAAAHPYGLTRQSSGLSEPHVALIKMLAEVAVQQYLAEIEPADDQQEAQP